MSVASPNLTTLKPPFGKWTFSVDLSLSVAGGRFSGLTAAAAKILPETPPPPPALLQFSRLATRGVGGADHSLRGGGCTEDADAQSARLGGGEDHSTRLSGGDAQSARLGGGDAQSGRPGGPAPLAAAVAILRAAAAAGRKLERDGLSVKKLSVASSDLEQETKSSLVGRAKPNILTGSG